MKRRLRIMAPRGFTLVELLIVVAIIGILAAIAIPQFAAYREKAYCAQIEADLANLALSQESYYFDSEIYLAATKNADGSSNVPNHQWTQQVTVIAASGDVNKWTAVVGHPNCSAGPFTYDSAEGGLQ